MKKICILMLLLFFPMVIMASVKSDGISDELSDFKSNSIYPSYYVISDRIELISLNEYNTTLNNNYSYLLSPLSYWIKYNIEYNKIISVSGIIDDVDNSKYSYVRPSVYVKSDEEVSGRGSYANPWKFFQKYNLTVDTNGGDCTDSNAGKYSVGSIIELTSSCERTGYTFNGWNVEDGSSTIENNKLTIKSDTTIKAQWTLNSYFSFTYTGSFNCNGTKLSNTSCDISSSDWYVKFLTDGTLNVTYIKSSNIDIFMIGGGGGGGASHQNASLGNYARGYGGNGGSIYNSVTQNENISVSVGTDYEIVVGKGGKCNYDGETTSAFYKTASGGASGKPCDGAHTTTAYGSCYNYGSGSKTGTGKGADGKNGIFAFNDSSIDNIQYGAGGGNGNGNGGSKTNGGLTGGGDGNGGDANDNTGSGGGGGNGHNGGDVHYNGGSGGSGIVIIRNHRSSD